MRSDRSTGAQIDAFVVILCKIGPKIDAFVVRLFKTAFMIFAFVVNPSAIRSAI